MCTFPSIHPSISIPKWRTCFILLTFRFPDFSSRCRLPKHAPSRVKEASELVQRAAERSGVRGAVGDWRGGVGVGLPMINSSCRLPWGIRNLGERAARTRSWSRVWLLLHFGQISVCGCFYRIHHAGLRWEREVCVRPVGSCQRRRSRRW